jgi:hypothetical protein
LVFDGDDQTHASPRAVLEAVLTHDERAGARDRAVAAAAREEDPRLLAERLWVTRAEELRARLSRVLGADGELLSAPEGWRLLRQAALVEEMGGDAARALAGVHGGADDLLRALRGAAPSREPTTLLAGLFPGPAPGVDPGVAAYQLSIGRRLEAWRASIEARILSGELAVPDALGRPPAEPAARAAWAYAVSVVALAQAARGEGATRADPERVESLRAAWARNRAKRLGGLFGAEAGLQRRSPSSGPSASRSATPRLGPQGGGGEGSEGG